MTSWDRIWNKLGGRGMIASLVIHAVLFVAAGSWVISELVAPKEQVFTSSNAAQDAAVQQIEHRVQLARRSGSSGGAEISAQRITGASVSSFALPELPETSTTGLGAIGGAGFGGGGFGFGSGSGMGFGSGTGGTAGTVRDVMSIFGAVRINSNNERIMFLIDVSDSMMTPQKGGFEAYSIVRAEMIRLITRLPLSVRFNAAVFDGSGINLFRPEMQPANSANKEAFVAWFDPINRDASRRGAGASNWRRKDPATELRGGWEDQSMRALTAAFEQQPTQVFMFTSNFPRANRQTMTPEELERARQRAGDTPEVRRARDAAYDRARRELEEVNQRLRAQGRNPIIIPEIGNIEAPVNQAAFRAAGVTPIRIDTTGWTDRQGNRINGVWGVEHLSVDDIVRRMRDVQQQLGGDRPRVNITMLIGPNDPQQGDQDNYTKLARAFNGRFNTIDFRGLQSLQRSGAQ
jgi:hypothetical protein